MRDRFLRFWAGLVLSRPGQVLALVTILLVASLVIVPGLQIEAGHSKLEDKDNIHQQRFASFLREFGSPNLLMGLAQGGNEKLRRQLMDRLIRDLPGKKRSSGEAVCQAAAAKNSQGCVRDVVGRMDLDRLSSSALLFLPLETVQSLVRQLEAEQMGLATLKQIKDLPALITTVNQELERRAKEPPPTGDTARDAERATRMVSWIFTEVAARISSPTPAKIPLEEAILTRVLNMPHVQAQIRKHGSRGIDISGYLSSPDGKLKIAFIRPVNDSDEPQVVVPFVEYVRRHGEAAASALNARCQTQKGLCPDGPLKLTLTGLPAIVADETVILKRDVTLTTVAAIGGILCLFYFGFRSLRQTALGLLPLLTGLLWTLAFVRLAFGSLNLITSAFIVTLLGLGIDFAVHLLSRFNEARQQGQPAREAAEAALLGAGPGILTGAMTTSGAFVALAASRFHGFSQLGIITGVGLIFVLLVTLTMMPAMLVHPSLSFLVGAVKKQRTGRAWGIDLPGLVVRQRKLFVAAGLLIAVAMLVVAQRIPWSYDYMKLMPAGLDSVEAMATLSQKSDFSAEVAAVVAQDLDQARSFSKQLAAKETIARVESVASFLPADQPPKLLALGRLKPLLTQRPTRTKNPVDLAALGSALEELSDTLQDLHFDAKRANADQAKLLAGPVAAVARLRKAIKEAPPARVQQRLTVLQSKLLAGIDFGLDLLWQHATGGPLTAAILLKRLPGSLRDRLYHDGRFAVYAYPAKPIWSKDYMGRFVADLRSVSPKSTGFPVTHWENSISIERGFRDASIIACIALVLLLLLDFRSLRYTLLAVAPLAMGITWMWGGMSLLGFSYNFVNVIAFPLIIGIGVASGVHILHRYRQEGERDVAPVVRFTGMAVFLSAATTMVGFGSLALAQHRGAASLGLVLLLGVGACLATSVLFLPALLKVLKSK